MRPRPRDGQEIIDELHFAWNSPSSAQLGAAHGLKPLVNPVKPMEAYHDDLDFIARSREEAGLPPARPRLHVHMFCHEDEDTARELGRRYMSEQLDSSSLHYEFTEPALAKTKGYEHYDATNVPGGFIDAVRETYLGSAICGTPEQCIERVRALNEALHLEEFLLTGRYGSMTHEEAVASMTLFSEKVLPAVHDMPLLEPIRPAEHAV
jgi:alkanesulfonate monooxygenase SsuD/methylene tetrahydromethanopterin reductase-like flavin-dependent oxidoreductase (luciferase family)